MADRKSKIGLPCMGVGAGSGMRGTATWRAKLTYRRSCCATIPATAVARNRRVRGGVCGEARRGDAVANAFANCEVCVSCWVVLYTAGLGNTLVILRAWLPNVRISWV
jgi:hypothetical protein